MAVEFRSLSADEVELRAEGDGMSFSGYAIRYNSPSEPLPFIETVLPGAASRSLKSRNEIKAFVNHDTNMVIGSTRAGTLRLSEDDKGLFAQIDLPDTTYGRDLAVSVKRGDVSGMSFGFSVPKGGASWNEDGSRRTLSEIRIHEVSPVTGFPAYKSTTAFVRALARYPERSEFGALTADLALRCDIDAAMLEVAVEGLLMAEKLDADAAALLRSVIDRMAEKPEEPTAEIEITVDDIPLSLLAKQLDLLKRQP